MDPNPDQVLSERFRQSVERFWEIRDAQGKKQAKTGRVDAGTRGDVTGGGHMAEIEKLVVEILIAAGIGPLEVKTRSKLELPGYFRAEKQWDLLVISRQQLVAAVEFKSQVGPSFGNNFNNRTEEAIGNATDLLTAFREGRVGTDIPPFLGYFFLLEDCPAVQAPVKNAAPHFPVDPIFKDASYSKRYEILCRRLVRERLYNAACLTLSPKPEKGPATISPAPADLSFRSFAAALRGHAIRFIGSQPVTP